MNVLAVSFLVLLAQTWVFPNPDSESWIDSPEAYFVTDPERNEWSDIATREEREAFQKRYWLMRDPTPGTEANEFRNSIRGRIEFADKTFGIGETPGSRTARGYVFIVFGSPARASQDYGAGPMQQRVLGQEGTDQVFHWSWDRERTPQLMNVLGRPKFEVDILLEPDRRRDRIMNPGLVTQFRDLLAEKSIVNPTLIGPAAAAPERIVWLERTGTVAFAQDEPLPSPDEALSSILVWDRHGKPRAIFWFVDPSPSAAPPRFQVHLRKEGATEGGAWTGNPTPTRQLISTTPGRIWSAALELEPGTWSGTFEAGPNHRSPVSFRVPEGAATSSLLLSGGPQAGEPTDPLVPAGPLLLLLRADATFTPGESLWYFLQLRDLLPGGVTIEPRLMKQGAGIVSAYGAFQPDAMKLAEGLHAVGYEIPLEKLAAGDYMLYVTVRTPTTDPIVQRSDFRIVNR